MQADKKKKESMSMWKIILIVNLAVYILSFVIPSGAYQRDGKMAVPGTYEVVEKTYLNPVDVILAVGDTVYSSFGKLFVTLIIMGGMMGIVNSTGVLDRALGNLIHRLKDKALAIIPIYVFATALLGCVGSMISTVILFVPLGLLIARKLRADRTFAVGLVILGSFTGFMSSPINPLTGVMGQEIAGLVPYSGAGLRTIVTILNVAVVSAYLVWWAKRCQKNTAIYEADFGGEEDMESGEYENTYKPLSGREMAILAIFFGAFIFFAAADPGPGHDPVRLHYASRCLCGRDPGRIQPGRYHEKLRKGNPVHVRRYGIHGPGLHYEHYFKPGGSPGLHRLLHLHPLKPFKQRYGGCGNVHCKCVH